MISLKQENRRPAKEEPNSLNKLRTASLLMGGAGAGSYLLGDYFLPKDTENLLEKFKRIDVARNTPSLLGYSDLASQLLHSKMLGGNVEGMDLIKAFRSPKLLSKIAPLQVAPAILDEWQSEQPQTAGILSKIQALPTLLDKFKNYDYKTWAADKGWKENGPLDSSGAHYGAFRQGPLHALGQLYSEGEAGYPGAAAFLGLPPPVSGFANSHRTAGDIYNSAVSSKLPEAINAFIKDKTGRDDYFKGSLINTYGMSAFPNALPIEEQRKLLHELPSWLEKNEKQFPEANKVFRTLGATVSPGEYYTTFGKKLLDTKHFLQKYGLLTAGAGIGTYGLYRFLKSRAEKKKKEKELLEQSN